MIDENKVRAAVEEFGKNDYFREMYEDAPTELSKRHTALSFYYSENVSDLKADRSLMDEYKKEKADLEDKMGLEDWKYLYSYCPNNPLKPRYKAKIDELEKAQSSND